MRANLKLINMVVVPLEYLKHGEYIEIAMVLKQNYLSLMSCVETSMSRLAKDQLSIQDKSG